MADYTAATIASLQPLIKKPVLKPALLQKPPFRFLHDIITNLQSSPTPFPPPQLFAADQLTSDNVKEKEQKLAFLARVVEVVEAVNGGKVDVSTAKVIAGLEPEKTNVLLQQLAAAAQKGLSEEEVMSKVQGGGTARKDSKPAEAKPASKPAAPAAKPAAAAPPAASKPAAAPPAASPDQSPQPTTRPKAASTSSTSASSSTAPSARRTSRSRAPITLPPAPDTPEDFTQTTQRLLGALITRPTLKPNLLQKPPFRFLHDIVTALIGSAAGYPSEYFSAEECDSGTLDSSEKKMGWLKKLIDVVEATSGEDLSGVQVKKIVAGLEADKTNLLLQALARAAASGVTAKEAMESKAGGAKPKEVESKPAAEAAPTKPANKATPIKATPAAAAAATAVTSPQVPKLALKAVDEPRPPIVVPVVPGMDAEAVGRLERPMTARQGPPKPKQVAAVEEKAEVREEKEADTKAEIKPAASNNKAAAAAADKRKGLIVEGEQLEEEDEIAEEAPADTQQAEQSIKQFEEEKLDASEQGGLMRKILQSTTDAAATDPASGAPTLATLTPASSADDRTSALRQQLQRLCQSITPLGRVMECVVDDMDEMAREMSRWRKQREEYEGSVEEERRASVRVLEPLQAQLEECERRLVEWERKVMVQKSVLWRNEHNIKKLMQQKVAGES